MSAEGVVLNWSRLLSGKRLDDIVGSPPAQSADIVAPTWLANTRTAAERDYDRVRFAAPVRRLADKTQVFPLERNDSVRNRLTHSDEVSALARSVGTHLAHSFLPDRGIDGHQRTVPALLAAAGLAHDLGNPPFGHQGEEAIRRWFRDRAAICFGDFDDAKPPEGALDIELEGARDMRLCQRHGNCRAVPGCWASCWTASHATSSGDPFRQSAGPSRASGLLPQWRHGCSAKSGPGIWRSRSSRGPNLPRTTCLD